MTRARPPGSYLHHSLPDDGAAITLGLGELADPTRFTETGQIMSREFRASTWQREKADLWDAMLHHAAPLISALAEDGPAAAEVASDVVRNGVAFGMGWARDDWTKYVTDPHFREKTQFFLFDWALSLAEGLGEVPVEYPEAGQDGRNAGLNGDQLMARLDKIVGYEIKTPNCYGMNFGIRRPGGICDHRALTAAYTAHRIKTLLASRGISPAEASVVELGGGLGNLAYQCLKMGIGGYTLVDIPSTRALQTYMALYEFPEVEINFSSAHCNSSGARLHLLTPDAVPMLRDRSVDIVVNEDSLTEINGESAIQYLHEIARFGRHYFLSSNHEAQYTVAGHRHARVMDLARLVPGLRPISRSRGWVRPGYVEELYGIA